MLSAGRLSKLMPMKVDGGRIETVLVEQDGPIAYVESTTLSKVFDEDENRSLMLQTDEREEQTRRIITRLAERHSTARSRDDTPVKLRHHAIQRMLPSAEVVIPYAERLGEKFECRRVEARRAFPQLLTMIQAVTLLHFRQRDLADDGRLIATAADYHLARRLVIKPLARSVGGGVSESARRFYKKLTTWASGDFTSREAVAHQDGGKSSVYGWLSELYECGTLEQVEPPRGRCPARWRLTGCAPEAGDGLLPPVREIVPDAGACRNRGHNAEPLGLQTG